MAEFNIAAILRASAYSPNHIGNDTAILNAVIDQLRKRGCAVTAYSEGQLANGDVKESIIINMCRERSSIEALQQYEQQGLTVINSGFGIENCTRERMTRLLVAHGIPYPESLIVDTDEVIKGKLREGNYTRCWIKRGDFHAMHKEDITYVRHPEEAQEVLQEYFLRGIPRAVINKHLVGDLIKFYGVRGDDFFYWFYPFDEGHSKYGWEVVNGKSHSIEFSLETLKKMCRRAAEILDIEIYGGDCIIDPDGSIRIIDFNDWPSFAPCRDKAAPAIAKHILSTIKEKRNG